MTAMDEIDYTALAETTPEKLLLEWYQQWGDRDDMPPKMGDALHVRTAMYWMEKQYPGAGEQAEPVSIGEAQLKELCDALGEPLETPSGHSMEPPYRHTWEDVVNLVWGRTVAWRALLKHMEVADPAWLEQWRSSR